MIKELENLAIEEREHLFRAPVLISVLAACSAHAINPDQKADAIKLAHLKPFTADPSLIPFYVEVEKNFEQEFEAISRQYSPFGDDDCNRLKEQVGRINLILKKMDPMYGSKLLRSFEKYERHVKRAAHNVVEDFIFPVPIPGINA